LIPTFSPQGDGNFTFRYTSYRRSAVDPYLFPARGRKHPPSSGGCGERSDSPVDPYLFPARGRKLEGLPCPEWASYCEVDPYLFPARGRKRHSYPPLAVNN